MFLAPSAAYAFFPWVLGFWIHAVAYLINALLFFATVYILTISVRHALPYALANGAWLVLFGSVEYRAGALYGIGDVALGLLLLAALPTVLRADS